MNLTKEDLAAIGSLIDEKLEASLAPLKKMFKQILNAQVEIVDNMEVTDGEIKLIMFHLNLSPKTRELRKTLENLE